MSSIFSVSLISPSLSVKKANQKASTMSKAHKQSQPDTVTTEDLMWLAEHGANAMFDAVFQGREFQVKVSSWTAQIREQQDPKHQSEVCGRCTRELNDYIEAFITRVWSHFAEQDASNRQAVDHWVIGSLEEDTNFRKAVLRSRVEMMRKGVLESWREDVPKPEDEEES